MEKDYLVLCLHAINNFGKRISLCQQDDSDDNSIDGDSLTENDTNTNKTMLFLVLLASLIEQGLT